MFSLFSLYVLSVCSLCMFSLYILTVLSVCSLCMFSLYVVSIISVLSVCSILLYYSPFPSNRSMQVALLSARYKTGCTTCEAGYSSSDSYICLWFYRFLCKTNSSPKRVKTGTDCARLSIVTVARIRVCDLKDFSVKQTPQRVRLHGYCNSDSISTCLWFL